MKTGLSAMPSMAGYVDQRWRTGTQEGQVLALAGLVAFSVLVLVGSVSSYTTFPAATFVLPMLLGYLTLRYRPLLVLFAVNVVFVAASVTLATLDGGMTPGRASTLVTILLVAVIILVDASRRHSGLPGALSEAMLVDLNERLQAQGVVPPLPGEWTSESAMRSAGGARFSGDFLVANLSEDERTLEMILVDVCGKGVAAGTQSLQLAGALGGLIGALPPLALFSAANDYLVRQDWEEGFATAVHVMVRLDTGDYSVISAGHPPALHWTGGEWKVDPARGVALGILRRPEFHRSEGRLAPGECLLFYTDGIVEVRDRDIDEGVEWLRGLAAEAVAPGLVGAAGRIIDAVEETDDDRAVLILSRGE